MYFRGYVWSKKKVLVPHHWPSKLAATTHILNHPVDGLFDSVASSIFPHRLGTPSSVFPRRRFINHMNNSSTVMIM
ncbi:hypothetical protein BDV11DRAFT_82406 [Aspergillus similis]